MFYFRHLSTTRHVLSMNSFQQRCLLHTCVPLMNQEKSTEKNKSSQYDEQLHMRIEAKASAENRGISIGIFFFLSFILIR